MTTKRKKKLSPLITLFLGGIILTIGDILAAQWVRTDGLHLYLLVLLFYLIGMIFLMSSYKREDIPVASTILVIFNVTILTFVGALVFGENITPQKIVGILLCFVAVFLLEFDKKKAVFIR